MLHAVCWKTFCRRVYLFTLSNLILTSEQKTKKEQDFNISGINVKGKIYKYGGKKKKKKNSVFLPIIK